MATSSWAYFLSMPCSINVLNVYAFCNWHDVSWGTKGSDEAASLPSAQTKTSDAKTNFVEELDKPQADIDTEFELTVGRALAPWKEPVESSKVQLDDSYRTFRTNLVLLWALSNSLLVLLINNANVRSLCLTVCFRCYPRCKSCADFDRRHRLIAPCGILKSSCGGHRGCRSSGSWVPWCFWRRRGFGVVSRGDNCRLLLL
ncbi:hypothetical protein AWENTII_008231 [Aspergillus wentii]